jgi:hypothetical protein
MMRAEKGARTDIGPSSFVLRDIGCGCRGRMSMIEMEDAIGTERDDKMRVRQRDERSGETRYVI